MNYGTKVDGNGVIKCGYLHFSTGRKVRLSAAEVAEFNARLRAERSTGKLMEQERVAQELNTPRP